jgi:4-amino-4-deoxy-L-arabinose transferase-like glycosyltransferase
LHTESEAPQGFKLTIFLMLFLLLYFFIYSYFLPAFDLDESLYLTLADRTETPFTWFNPLWDSEPYYHKPPLYLWILQFTKGYFFSVPLEFQTFLARLLSCLIATATLGISVSAQKKDFFYANYNSIPQVAFEKVQTPFFLATCGLILLDPLLCLFLALQWLYLRQKNQLTMTQFLACGIATGFAFATKGLIAVVVPSIIIFIIFLIYKNWKLSFQKLLSVSLGFLIGSFYYAWIYLNGGEKFVTDFFLVHHFKRSSQSFEGHSGPFYYYVPIIILGLGPIFWKRILNSTNKTNSFFKPQKNLYFSQHFDVVWVFCWLGFFSILATKLPNYIWPCFLPIILVNFNTPKFILRFLYNLNICVWYFLGAVISCLPFVIFPVLTLLEGKIDPRAFTVANSIEFLTYQKILLSASGIFILLWIYSVHKNIDSLKKSALLALFGFGTASMGLGMLSQQNITGPITQAVNYATQNKNSFEKNFKNQNISTVGLLSPNASLAFKINKNNQLNFQQFGKGQYKFAFEKEGINTIILPVWLTKHCKEYNYQKIIYFKYIAVCSG